MKVDTILISSTCTRYEYYEDAVYNYPKDSFRRKPCYVCYEYAEAPSKDLTPDPSAEIEEDGFITWFFNRSES